MVHTASLEWQASPSPTVWRKRLELRGSQEAGRVTSIVRYDSRSSFASHGHPDGEEILVLEGTFSDEHGDYPAGSFLLNPEGFFHAPFSNPGCRLFVKLRQYPGTARTQVLGQIDNLDWHAGDDGVWLASLYQEVGYPEQIRMLRLETGAAVELPSPGGVEILVLEGDLEDGTDNLVEGSWGLYPSNTRLSLRTKRGALCYLKSGHLALP